MSNQKESYSEGASAAMLSGAAGNLAAAGWRDLVDVILHYASQNHWLVADFLILLYAGKSMAVVFPLLVFQLCRGILFPPVTAVAVNLLGIGVSYCIPYLMGRSSREETALRLAAKYPKVAEIIAAQQKGDFFHLLSA